MGFNSGFKGLKLHFTDKTTSSNFFDS